MNKELSAFHYSIIDDNIFPPIIETERLILRPRRLEDAADIFEYARDPEVARYVRFEPHKSIEDSIQWIESSIKQYEAKECYDYAIVLKENGKVIGSGGALNTSRLPHRCEIGYTLGQQYWGKGLMPEAMQAFCDYMFKNRLVHRIEAYHHIDNEKSGRVMQKIGMVHEGTHTDRFFDKEKYQTVKCYAFINPYN